jgi:hypothetical protein
MCDPQQIKQGMKRKESDHGGWPTHVLLSPAPIERVCPRSRKRDLGRGVSLWIYLTLPPQSAWPHRQMISILFPIPAQWSLQYFALLGGTQVQVALPHFLGLAIVLLCRSVWCHPELDIPEYDAKIEAKDSRRVAHPCFAFSCPNRKPGCPILRALCEGWDSTNRDQPRLGPSPNPLMRYLAEDYLPTGHHEGMQCLRSNLSGMGPVRTPYHPHPPLFPVRL